jgi:hypothetical protein
MKAIAVAALMFAMSAFAVGGLAQRATQDQTAQPQAAPRMMQGTGPGMMGGGGTMGQMGQMMNRHQQMMDYMNELMQSMSAIEAEKDPAALRAKLEEHRALLEKMRSQMTNQGQMMQQFMGCTQPPAASGTTQPPAAK